jgi:glycosyltransferase involved in cell wall biosynthesis
MAAGKAIVASRAAAIPEVVPHGSLVEPGNPEALAAAIEQLHQSPAKRQEMGRTGAQWVEQFDAPRVARLFLEAASGVATGLSA